MNVNCCSLNFNGLAGCKNIKPFNRDLFTFMVGCKNGKLFTGEKFSFTYHFLSKAYLRYMGINILLNSLYAS